MLFRGCGWRLRRRRRPSSVSKKWTSLRGRTATYHNLDDEETKGAEHQAQSSPEAVDYLRADYGADNANSVESSGQAVLRQAAVPSLAEEDWRVRRDSLSMLAD